MSEKETNKTLNHGARFYVKTAQTVSSGVETANQAIVKRRIATNMNNADIQSDSNLLSTLQNNEDLFNDGMSDISDLSNNMNDVSDLPGNSMNSVSELSGSDMNDIAELSDNDTSGISNLANTNNFIAPKTQVGIGIVNPLIIETNSNSVMEKSFSSLENEFSENGIPNFPSGPGPEFESGPVPGKVSKAVTGATTTIKYTGKAANTILKTSKFINQVAKGNSSQAAKDIAKRVALKTTNKAIVKPLTKPLRNFAKKTMKKVMSITFKLIKGLIIKLVALLFGFILGSGAIIPCVCAVAVFVTLFGGGSNTNTVELYEQYILITTDAYKEQADFTKRKYDKIQVNSFDGTYGRIDWRAALSVLQGISGNLKYDVNEVKLLNKFQHAGLYEEQVVTSKDDTYTLTITNSSLDDYIAFVNNLMKNDSAFMQKITNKEQTAITDEQMELINSLYKSADLFTLFSPTLQQYGTIVDGSNGDSLSGLVVNGDSEKGNEIARIALTKTGYRYWWGAPGGGFGDGQKLDDINAAYFDCSGLVAWSFRQSGINLPRLTASGYSKSGEKINYEVMQAGDVITFSYDNGQNVSHIGIYIGGGKMVHASGVGAGTVGQYPEQCVIVSPITEDSYFYKYIHNCRRLY